MSRSLPSPLLAFVVVVVAGCGGDEGREAAGRPANATTESRCDIGGRPRYFVPGGDDGPLAIIGCARLGASGKPIELSVDYERIGRVGYVCVNPAYRGRGQLGIYIPAACVRDPAAKRLDVVSIEVPSQGVRDYGLVIWGTADPSVRTVHAGFDGAETRAALFPVRRRLAHDLGASRPFGVFVVELHPRPDCARVWARTPTGEITTVAEHRPRLCSAS